MEKNDINVEENLKNSYLNLLNNQEKEVSLIKNHTNIEEIKNMIMCDVENIIKNEKHHREFLERSLN